MQLEKYFQFIASDDIRIKGTRIGIESVLYEYIHRSQTPENITHRFPSLTLEQIYATILYYLQNRKQIDSYLKEWLKHSRQMRSEQDSNPPPVIIKLRNQKRQHQEVT